MSKRNRALGKKQPLDDSKRLHMARYLKQASLPVTPASVDWTAKLTAPLGEMGNDYYGDCTAAAVAHSIQVYTANSSTGASQQVNLSDAEVLDFYQQLSPGFNPETDANDNGATCVSALNYWRKFGVFGHKITAYVDPEPSNVAHIQASIYLFEGVYIGLAMPESADTQTDAGDPWSVPSSGVRRGVGVPGSWGGHCVNCCKFDANYIYCISWGEIIPMTWGFWAAYCDEAHTPITQDVINKVTHLAPNGFSFAQLTADLKLI
jgi:hypothetical protein